MSGGFAFDPKTRDFEYAVKLLTQKGGELEKLVAARKNAQTMFGSFRTAPEESVFHFHFAHTLDPAYIAYLLPHVEKMFEEGIKVGDIPVDIDVKMVTKDGDLFTPEAVKSMAESWRKIVLSNLKSGTLDIILTQDVNGTLMFGMSMADTGEFQNLMRTFFIGMMDNPLNDKDEEKTVDGKAMLDRLIFLGKNFRIDESTIEGFKVSSLKMPMEEMADLVNAFADEEKPLPKAYRDMTLGVFWAVKENEAVAFAIGPDFAETEKTFKKALAGVKGKVPVQQPLASFSLPNYGKSWQKFMPMIESALDESPEQKAKAIKGLEQFKTLLADWAKSDKDNAVTLSETFTDGGIEVSFKMPGKMIDLYVLLIKSMMQESCDSEPASGEAVLPILPE
jgi:hypothetical protein